MMNNEDRDMLQIAQNRALRCLTGGNIYTSIKWMLECTGLLSVQQSIISNVLIFIYKLLNGLLPHYMKSNLKMVSKVHNYKTRSSTNIFLPHITTTRAKNHIFFKGIQLYNSLPRDIKSSKSIGEFKSSSKKYILKNYNL